MLGEYDPPPMSKSAGLVTIRPYNPSWISDSERTGFKHVVVPEVAPQPSCESVSTRGHGIYQALGLQKPVGQELFYTIQALVKQRTSSLRLVSSSSSTKNAAMFAVIEDTTPVLVTIITTTVTLPPPVAGDKSPYPTVVRVTTVHHRPSSNV